MTVNTSRSVAPGDWFGIFGEGISVLLPPAAKPRVAAVWEAVDDGAGFDELLDSLIRDGLRELPGFVLVSVDHGDAKVVILADYTHTSSLWNDTERAFLLQRPSTDILNGSIAFKSGGNWDVTAGMTNITDERYLVTGQAQIAGGQFYGTFSRPREWYVKLGLNF